MTQVRSAVWSVVVVAVLALVSLEPAAAHTDLVQASPGVNQTSGGEVQFLDLAFGEPISNLAVTVTDPVGEEVSGRVLVDQGFVVSYEFDEPLTTEGRYMVDYTMTSFDLDFTEKNFIFTYEESAPQAFRIGSDGQLISEPVGTNWLSLFSTLLLVISAVGIAILLLHRQGFFRSSRVLGEPEAVVDGGEIEVDDESDPVTSEVDDDSEE